ncbi:MAG: amidohydrolase family protein, partial [Candidatus Obscuribacterales bacterium]|nr:amidohydrolase family protein [Candidatus Obscuribacterales bacterium]
MQGKTLLLLIASFLCLTASAAHAEKIAIKAGRLIDVDNAKVLNDQVIIVENGKIKELGPGLQIPAGVQTIDLSKQTVLPGLIDCHTHLIGSPADYDPIMEAKKSAAQKVLESIPNAKKTLEAGFTSVRDRGTYRALIDLALRDAINRGDVLGPRMFASGAYLTITKGGGALTGFAPDITLPWDMHFGEADDPWTVRKRVRELAHYGVDQIKIIATGAV